jgi:hypothetical protein
MARFQVGDVYPASFRLAFGNFGAFLRTQGVLLIAMALVNLAFTLFVVQDSVGQMFAALGGKGTPDPAKVVAALVPLVVGGLTIAALTLVVNPAVYGVGLKVADAVSAGQNGITLGQSWDAVRPRYGALLRILLSLIGAAFGVFVAVAVAGSAFLVASPILGAFLLFLLFCVAAVFVVWLLLRWFLALAVGLFEGRSARASLKRSSELTDGSRGAILGLLILLILTFIVPVAIVGSMFSPSPTFNPSSPALTQTQPSLAQQLGSWVVTTAFSLLGGFVGISANYLVYKKLAEPAGTPEPGMGPIAYSPPPAPPL